MRWAANLLVELWTGRAFGSMAVLMFFIWRMRAYFQIEEWVRAAVEAVQVVSEQIDSLQDLKEENKLKYDNGDFETPR